ARQCPWQSSTDPARSDRRRAPNAKSPQSARRSRGGAPGRPRRGCDGAVPVLLFLFLLLLLSLLVRPHPAHADPDPDPDPCASVGLTDVAAALGIQFTHDRGGTGAKHLPETMGAGLAWLDFDGDGWMDLYL